MKRRRLLAPLLAGLAAAALAAEVLAAPSVTGSWRVYSSRIDYDAGGGGVLQTPASRQLKLKAGGRWEYGSSSGRWSTARIVSADWKRWGTEPYGPKSKIVLRNWARTTATGPIETSGGRVDFIWAIYHAKPPTVRSAGLVQIKFGRVRP